MKKIFIILVLLNGLMLSAQNTDKQKEVNSLIEQGVKSYNSADYILAEKSFRKALAIDPVNASASYNLANAQLEQDKTMEAEHFFEKAVKTANDNKKLKSKAAFNQGNIWYNKKKYEKAVEAYKTALRNNPDDEEARYNLALAQKMLKKNNKNNKNDKKNKENKDNKNKDKKNKDKKNDNKNKNNKKNEKKKQDDKNKNDQKKGDKKEDQKKKEQGKKKQEKDKKSEKKQGEKKQSDQKQGEKQKVKKRKLTPQQVKQLLVALKNKEKKTQNKIKAKRMKGSGKKVKQDKDW
jgi:tetratricopeptide (TPR) repeat protein